MSEKMKGNILLFVTALLWGSGFISQKMANEVMPPMSFNAIRQIMAAVVLIPIALNGLKRSGYLSAEQIAENVRANVDAEAIVSERKIRMIKAGIMCGTFLLVGTAAQQIGLVSVSAGKSGFITSLYIVIVPLFSIIVGNKVSVKSIVCVFIALAGFAIMSLHGGFESITFGDWLTLLGAVAFAAQIVAVNQFVDKENPLMLSCLQFLVCGAIGLVIAIAAERPTMSQIAAGLPMLLYQTIVPTAIGYTLQIVAQKYTDSTTSALIMSTESVFAALFGLLILGEAMTAREVLGAAIIFAAIILGQADFKRKSA